MDKEKTISIIGETSQERDTFKRELKTILKSHGFSNFAVINDGDTDANHVVWLDFSSTYSTVDEPERYDFRVPDNRQTWVESIAETVMSGETPQLFDPQKDTVMMLGRWQPWHVGHRALFERLLARTGQVAILIRDCGGTTDNPLATDIVAKFIRKDLEPLYKGKFSIFVVPNITHIGWGRNVGYTASEETFDDSITQISATRIRAGSDFN